ncbi:MAG: CYTH domain-containing protein, partial [Pseudomonadota bacterium]
MREIELKIELDAAQARRLGSSAALKSLAVGRAETRTLWSIYFDTDDHRLRARGIALRLRRCNGRWVQTLKQATAAIEGGLSQPREFEYPVDGRKLDLT